MSTPSTSKIRDVLADAMALDRDTLCPLPTASRARTEPKEVREATLATASPREMTFCANAPDARRAMMATAAMIIFIIVFIVSSQSAEKNYG